MNELQKRKIVRDLQKPIPGCMWRMANILDLNAGTTGKNMLTDRASRHGSPVRIYQSDVRKKVINPVAPDIEDKPVTYEQKICSSRKMSSGTPMKMLLAQEMSGGTETKQKPPGVVAKLMGLDALPVQQPVPTAERTSHKCYKHGVYGQDAYPSDLDARTCCYGQQGHGYLVKTTRHDMHLPQYPLNEQKEIKDVYEIWPQPSSNKKDHPLPKSHNVVANENRMALVHQKFMEAKRLATDQKLLQTKEFQDALEVLNSNRDLFLKFLEEPNSLFSKHLQELRTAPTPSQTKRITVLKPSNSVRYNNCIEMRKLQILEDEKVHKDSLSRSPSFGQPKADNISEPTRIVVLKPSPKKLLDLKASLSSPTSCRASMKGRELSEESGTDETRESRERAKDITQYMRESLSGNRMDETWFPSVLSYGYVGDESSFNRSENEFMEDDHDGNFSDSEILTPTARHSWDYVYQSRSPCSRSSLSQTSYSPESSVIREAKKRLSERWAMVASNQTSQERIHVRKSSSTLGEMLAISEMKKVKGNDVLSSRSSGGEQGVRLQVECSSLVKEDASSGSNSPRNLLRSKSVPVCSSAYDNIGLITDSTSQVDKSNASKDLNRSKSGKLSLRGKVSSLFSRNKRSSREKTATSPLVGTPDTLRSANLEYVGKRRGGFFLCTSDNEQGTLDDSEELTRETSSLPASENGAKEAVLSTKAAASLEKPGASENSSENLEQPSPISVLEAHYEEDVNSSSSRSSECANLEACQLMSRSPPIEPVTRSLPWDEAQAKRSPSKLPMILSKKDEDGEQYSFVKDLLSSAGFDDEKSSSVLERWHSPESPLDPMLLDKFMEHKDEEAKGRERRSNHHLLFDCVNAALLSISKVNLWEISQAKSMRSSMDVAMPSDASITEQVWGRMKEWCLGQEKPATSRGENIGLAVDRVLRKEVAGSGWAVMMSSETDEIGKEIQGKVLEELVEEALADLIPGWF